MYSPTPPLRTLLLTLCLLFVAAAPARADVLNFGLFQPPSRSLQNILLQRRAVDRARAIDRQLAIARLQARARAFDPLNHVCP